MLPLQPQAASKKMQVVCEMLVPQIILPASCGFVDAVLGENGVFIMEKKNGYLITAPADILPVRCQSEVPLKGIRVILSDYPEPAFSLTLISLTVCVRYDR
ncbi:hypothetical protein O9993_11120 [Vibrio lentus]|nr:hypothetical protein [Vibrio lentus]